MMTGSLDQLIIYCRENGRVCPVPQQWNRLYEMLPDKSPRGAGWEPSAPLILAAWWEASDAAKQERLELHLRWAAEHDALERVEAFVRSLAESEWYHRGD
jgi:hypothetical protein